MAQSEDSPVAMKLKKICLKTPVGEEQAAQAVLDPALGEFNRKIEILYLAHTTKKQIITLAKPNAA